MLRRAALAILCLFACAPVRAQSTRAEAIAEQQAEKAKQLGVEGPSETEAIIKRLLLSPLLSGGDGIYPWFGSVFSGTGAGVGAGFLKRLEKAASINVFGGVSLNNSMIVEGRVAAPVLWRGRLQLDATARWLDARGV